MSEPTDINTHRRRVTENAQEFLMRTLSADQWRVVAECLRVEVGEARADEREQVAQAIEAKRVPRKDMYERDIYVNDGLNLAARIARGTR